MTTPKATVIAEMLCSAAASWLDSYRDKTGEVKPGIIATGLTVTGKLLQHFPLEPDQVATPSQIRNIGGPAIAKILAQFGEERPFLREGGRTSRENRDRGLKLAADYNLALDGTNFELLNPEDRTRAVDSARLWFVERIQMEYFARQRIKAEIFANVPASVAVGSLIEAGIKHGGNTAGAVAQHLVGAKLSLRFPDEEIGNDSYTTADQQTKRQGDFTVGDTAFHVTMSPTPQLMSGRCLENINHGYRPVVLVPIRLVAAAAAMAEMANLTGKVSIVGIEDFVGLNVEEMGTFRSDGIRQGLRLLLETYNKRVGDVEVDPSLLIEIPENL